MRLLRILGGILGGLAVLNALAAFLLGPLHYVPDPRFGAVIPPGEGTYRAEGWGRMRRLPDGLRASGNPELPGSLPILVSGDSETEAISVDDREAYPSVAERALRDQGWAVTLLNHGRSRRSLAHYCQLALTYRRVFAPAWTVLQLNDDDFREEAWNPALVHFSPSLRVEGDDRATLIHPPAPLVGYAYWRWLLLRQPPGSEAPPPLDARFPVLAELDALCAAYGDRLTLVYLCPFRPEDPGASSPLQEAVERRCRERGLSYLNFARQGPELIGWGHAPRGFANTRYNSGHLNAWGHRALGEALARELQSLHRRGIL